MWQPANETQQYLLNHFLPLPILLKAGIFSVNFHCLLVRLFICAALSKQGCSQASTLRSSVTWVSFFFTSGPLTHCQNKVSSTCVSHRIRLYLWWWLSGWGAVEHAHSRLLPTANFRAALLDSPNYIGLNCSNFNSKTSHFVVVVKLLLLVQRQFSNIRFWESPQCSAGPSLLGALSRIWFGAPLPPLLSHLCNYWHKWIDLFINSFIYVTCLIHLLCW